MLRDIFAQEDAVLFIGSGISRWAGLPSWHEFIDELANFLDAKGIKSDLVRAEARRNDLLQAASYGFDRLTKPQIGEFIRIATRYGIATPHAIHQLIVTLGPRCFVTTNYDDLIEQSLRKWQADRFYRPAVTNRHLTETAEIIHARATDFIFKPHGDAADSESIILTKEQYRDLLPQGDRHAALDALKTLLVSRPVVYLGFGLRDPDFSYLRDILANTYKGTVRDHYAVVSDVSAEEIDYWRRQYGIHIIDYSTSKKPDGSEDHSALLRLLENNKQSTKKIAKFDPKSPEKILTLARYAAALERNAPQVTPEVQIRVLSMQQQSQEPLDQSSYNFSSVEQFLDEGPKRALLTGLPGAGKTYAMRRAAARAAENLHLACLSGSLGPETHPVPIYADLKLYSGDLEGLINATLPPGLELGDLRAHFKQKIFVDSFNEMPREYRESGDYESDFAKFLSANQEASIIFGSRTDDGLGKLTLSKYALDQIDYSTLRRELENSGITISGRFEYEILELLQKPFYFQLVTKRRVAIPSDPHPRDIYSSLFAGLQKEFQAKFSSSLNLERTLSIAAYNALERGEEAFPLSDVLLAIDRQRSSGDVTSTDIANWLVAKDLLIPYSGGRVSFIHQSVTEYLAALELAKIYDNAPDLLSEKLTLTRWDQALFLALGFLAPDKAHTFFNDVAGADLELALNAVKYVESGRDQLIEQLLSRVEANTHPALDTGIPFLIRNLPVSACHEAQLMRLVERGNAIGGSAAICLVAIKGAECKDLLFDLLTQKRDDFNFCANGVGPALKEIAEPEDAQRIAKLICQFAAEGQSNEEDIKGFISGASDVLEAFDLEVAKHALFPTSGPQDRESLFKALVLTELLWHHESDFALALAADLLELGFDDAAVSIAFITGHGVPEPELSCRDINNRCFERLVQIALTSEEYGAWAASAIRSISKKRPDLAARAGELASHVEEKFAKEALLHYAGLSENHRVLEALASWLNQGTNHLSRPVWLLKNLGVDWRDDSRLFIELLRLKDTGIALPLIEGIEPFSTSSTLSTTELDFEPIEEWLEWLSSEEEFFFRDRLGLVLAHHSSKSTRQALLAEFNSGNSKYRSMLARYVLRQTEVSTDDFSAESISYLLAELTRRRINTFEGSLLGHAATEHFVLTQLMPLLPTAREPLLSNLLATLRTAGRRHGRRYSST